MIAWYEFDCSVAMLGNHTAHGLLRLGVETFQFVEEVRIPVWGLWEFHLHVPLGIGRPVRGDVDGIPLEVRINGAPRTFAILCHLEPSHPLDVTHSSRPPVDGLDEWVLSTTTTHARMLELLEQSGRPHHIPDTES